MSDVLEAAEVRILRLQPGDEIIVKIADRGITEGSLREIKRTAEERWPGHRVTVVHQGIDIELLRSVDVSSGAALP